MKVDHSPGRARRVLSAMEVAGFAVLAVVAPTVSDVTASGDLAVNTGMRTSDVVVAALVFVAMTAAVAFLVLELARLVKPRLGDCVRVALLVGLVGLWAIQLARVDLGADGLAAAAAVTAAIGMLVAVLRWAPTVIPTLAAMAPVVAFLPLATDGLHSRATTSDPELQLIAENRAPVVIVVFDALPLTSLLDGSGQIDDELYPSFSRLAADSTWYRNHVTVGLTTLDVVPVLVRGTAADVGTTRGVDKLYEANLLQAMDHGFRVISQEPVIRGICPETCEGPGLERPGTATLLELGREMLVHRVSGRSAADEGAPLDAMAISEQVVSAGAVELTRSSIDELDGDEPLLAYMHVLLPHSPYTWTEDCVRYQPLNSPYGTFGSSASAEATRQGHLLQAGCADRLLGELLDRLAADGIYDDSMVVVVSDHGDSATPGQPPRFLGDGNAHELLWTPLLVKLPGQTEGSVNDVLVRPQDVLPTVLSVLGASPTWPIDGIELGERADARTARVFAGEWTSGVATDDGWVDVDVDAGFRQVLEAGPWGVAVSGGRSLYGSGAHSGLLGTSVDTADLEAIDEGLELTGLGELGSESESGLSLGLAGSVSIEGARAVAVVSDGVVVAVADLEGAVDSTGGSSADAKRFWMRVPVDAAGPSAAVVVVRGEPRSEELLLAVAVAPGGVVP